MNAPDYAAATTSPDATAWAALRAWERECDAGTRERGADYARRSRVQQVLISSDAIVGIVQGSDPLPYRTTFAYNTRQRYWTATCDCPVGVSCKHAVATAIEAIRRAPKESMTEDMIAVAAREQTDDFIAAVAATSARKLNKSQLRTLELMADAAEAFAKDRTTTRTLEYLHTEIGTYEGYAERNTFISTVESEQPKTPQAVLAALALARQGKYPPLPTWLADAVAGIPSIAQAFAKMGEDKAMREWRGILTGMGNGHTAAAPRPAPATTALRAFRLARTAPWLFSWQVRRDDHAEWATADAAFKRELALASFIPEGRFNDESLPAIRFFRKFMKEVSAAVTYAPADVPADAVLLGRILSDSLMRSRTTGPDGAPIRTADTKLIWSFRPSPAKPGHLRPYLTRTDGTPAPSPLIALGGSLHLAEEGLVHGPKALGGYAGLGAPPDIPAAVFEDSAVKSAVKSSGARILAASDVRHIPLRPRIRLTAKMLGSSLDIATADLDALDDAGVPRLRYDGKNWLQLHHPGDNPDDLPDLMSVEVARAHFDTSGSYEGRCGSVLLHGAMIDDFVDWISGFPKNTLFESPPELAGLLLPPTLADYAVEVEEAGRDWFDLKLVLKASDAELTEADLKLLLNHRGEWVRIPGKGWRKLDVGMSAEARTKIEKLGLNADAPAGEKLRFHAAQLAGEKLAGIADAAAVDAVRARAAKLTLMEKPALPAGLTATLRPYQHEGYHFLAHLASNGLGGVLADDMGLGKTLQTITWLLWLKEARDAQVQSSGGAVRDAAEPTPKPKSKAKAKKAVADAPSLDEAISAALAHPAPRTTHAGDSVPAPFKALIVAPKSVTANWVAECAKFAPGLRAAVYGMDSAAAVAAAHVVVVNYTRMRLAAETFTDTPWTAVVLDEGQHIKNPTSQVAEAARALKADHRLVLSGTPVENRLLDLWSLYSFAMPGLLGTHASFKRHYDEKRDPAAASRLATRVRPFLLRRTKSQVATDLPERIEEDLVIELEPAQRKLYDVELKKVRAMLLDAKTARDFDKSRFNILSSLLRLRQICCDPRLVSPQAKADDSAKLDALWELVQPLAAEGHKVLVFSQFTEALALIGEKLDAEKVPFLKLTGATENRAALVERFQKPETEKVFLLSLKAAGTGLNLTAASYVVMFDPWWNPAAEAQAIDRTHRIGQKNRVIAYRLIARNTVEEKIRALQRDKAALAGEILQEESLAKILDLATLRGILAE